MRLDPSARVRAAALTRWVALEGEHAITDAIRALEDPAARVNQAAAKSLATLDPAAISALREAVDSDSEKLARLAVGTLSMMGTEAHLALLEIAASHPSETMRTLARIAVGQPIGHRN
jgi:HEAT repeat protein